MKPWAARPREVRNHLNPAFCGLVIFRAIQSFAAADPRGLPYSLSLLILPLCLPPVSREPILEHPRSSILALIEQYPQLLVDFPRRVEQCLPFTQEGLAFLLNRNCFEVSPEGRFRPRSGRVLMEFTGTFETDSCGLASRHLGRTFARVGDRTTIYAALGIRP